MARLDPALREALAVLLDALDADAGALPPGARAALAEVEGVLAGSGTPSGVEELAARRRRARAARDCASAVVIAPPRWAR